MLRIFQFKASKVKLHQFTFVQESTHDESFNVKFHLYQWSSTCSTNHFSTRKHTMWVKKILLLLQLLQGTEKDSLLIDFHGKSFIVFTSSQRAQRFEMNWRSIMCRKIMTTAAEEIYMKTFFVLEKCWIDCWRRSCTMKKSLNACA